jgi:signal transduction histidine kinase
MTVAVTVSGTPATLSPATDVAAYRLVQEALTNARRHSPGAPVTVTVDHHPEDITMTIHNGRAGHPPADAADGGHGLLGMRERVRQCGGDLRVGPDDGGWTVTARLPTGHREQA